MLERERVVTRECEIDDGLLIAAWQLERSGRQSPALAGMAANVEIDCDEGHVTYRLPGQDAWGVLCKGNEIPSLVIGG